MKTTLNKLQVDYTKQPVFFGQDLSLQRYDKVKYPIFLKLFKSQMEFFWRPEEISLLKDRNDFQTLTDAERFVFTSNLKYQTLMDSVIGRGINVMIDNVTIPEAEACMSAWQFFETIHSYSYTYIIQNVFPDSSSLFDSISKDSEIMKRAVSVSREYDRLLSKPNDMHEAVYLSLVSTNILESMRFYVSFACGFFFGEKGKMVGNASILKLINRDENLHVAITQDLLKILRENKDEGFQDTINKSQETCVEMFRSAANEEKEWVNYLFSQGSVVGLNEKVMHGYIEWLADKRMQAVGLPKIYNVKHNPIGGWLSNWVDSQKVQVAPQETEILSYKVKASISDLGSADFSGLL